MKFRFLSMLMHSKSSQREQQKSRRRQSWKKNSQRHDEKKRRKWKESFDNKREKTEFCLFADDETLVMKM